MDYEEKYNAALERAAKLRVQNPFDTVGQMVEYIFPELKENENEKIRKDILCYFEHYAHDINGIDVQKWINWLEKQGEQPTDKVEPKFKVGDWITDGYVNCRITEILDDRYIIESKYNKRSAILFENKNRYHLWTINDAQDGDILSGEIDGEVFVFLFNQIQDRWIVAHVYYSETDGEFIEKAYLHRYHSFSPATKEQHNLLFQKMEEAGYDWDSEKKKLKKIESKTSLL